MQYHSRRNRSNTGLLAAWAGVFMLLAMPLVAAAQDNVVEIGVPPWPGERVKAEVAAQILEAIGYEVKKMDASWAIILQGVANGDIDVDMGIWKPTQNSMVNPLLEKGAVEMVVTNIKDAKYSMVVPQYVCEAGITSIGDLHKKAEQFNYKVYGIEAGNDGNKIVLDAIDNDTYNLSGWELVPSSTAGMLTMAERKISSGEWIVFLGWKPHWMNVIFDLCYLADPKNIWGTSTVHTVANPHFLKANPELATFFANMVVPADVQSDWIYTYGYEDTPLEETASQWIKSHVARVKEWLQGVAAADGRPAAEVFKTEFKAS